MMKKNAPGEREAGAGYRIPGSYEDPAERYFWLPRALLGDLPRLGEAELKVLLYLYGSQGGADPDEIGRALFGGDGHGEQIDYALAFLCGAGYLDRAGGAAQPAEKKPPEPQAAPVKEAVAVHIRAEERPNYTSEQIGRAFEGQGELQFLQQSAQTMIGKIFTPHETAVLYGMRDWLGLPAAVILMIIEWCCAQDKRNLRYIEKVAVDFADRGLDDCEKAEGYIASRRRLHDVQWHTRRIFGMGERALSAKEQACLAEWAEWECSPELLELAYNRTVDRTAKPSVAYAHAILKSWRELELRTAEDVTRYEQRRRDDAQPQGQTDYNRMLERALGKHGGNTSG